jgi:sugar/nucleoside kinase (ribokinase family)
VVGDDFPKREVTYLRSKGIDTAGLETVPGGKTFSWGGRYFDDINQRETLFTHLNVFEKFAPKLPDAYRGIRDVFLANIDPDLQLDVLRQSRKPRLVVCDTMNLWINIKRDSLLQLLKQIHVLLLNDEEARMLGGTSSLVKAAEAIRRRGVERLLIKKGEHGCLMFGPEGVFSAPALALPVVKDPTGAGATFAGGMLGWIAGRPLTPANWRKAILVAPQWHRLCRGFQRQAPAQCHAGSGERPYGNPAGHDAGRQNLSRNRWLGFIRFARAAGSRLRCSG